MKTYNEVIEAMLDLQDRMTRIKVRNPNYKENEYYNCLKYKLQALKFVVGIVDVIA